MATKAGSIADLGIKQYLDQNFMYRGETRLGGFAQYESMLKKSDSEIADYFGVTRQAVGPWRRRYHAEYGNEAVK